MNELISPKYLMQLIENLEKIILEEYKSTENIRYYINKWKVNIDFNTENFNIINDQNGNIDLTETLHNIDGETLLKIAIELGIETPNFIPSIPTFRNEIKSDYKTAHETFENAFKQIETAPDIAVGLANSALESIIKEIFKDERIITRPKPGKTLYDLSIDILKELKLFPDSTIPIEIKTIGSSLLSIVQSIEKVRSEKTTSHGKTSEDYIINDSLYTYFIVNSVATVGQFLISYYKNKFPNVKPQENENDKYPFLKKI